MNKSYVGYLLACDIRDYTLKTSFLGVEEVEKLLLIFDNIIKEKILLGKIKILKNTGDGYLFFSDEISADGLILKIFDFYEAVNRYNAGIKDELYKLNVRFSLHKGVVYEKNTLSGKDYFGKDLNILYRILDNTPADHIYISESVYKSLKDIDIKRRFIYFGEVQLKGIVETINLYASFGNNQLKNKFEKVFKEHLLKDLKAQIEGDKFKLVDKIRNIDNFIFNISAITAVVTSQPLPFADISFVLLVYFYMINEIGKYYGFEDENFSYKLVFSLLSSLGFEYIKDWLKIWILKIGLPFIGGYIQIPLSFAMTWSFGKLVSFYYYKKSLGEELSIKDLKDYFIKRKKDGYFIAKKKKDQIIEYGKENKKIFLGKIKELRKKLDIIKSELES